MERFKNTENKIKPTSEQNKKVEGEVNPGINMKNISKILEDNDINQTIPKPIAKTILKFGSLPNQLNFEMKVFTSNILEKYNSFKHEVFEKQPQKKLTDEEIKNFSETLVVLRHLPREEQDQKLKDVKESLSWFKFELGKAENKIIKGLLKNTPKSKEKIFEYIKNNLAHLPISDSNYEEISKMSDRFFNRYMSVMHARESMTDEEIFKAISKYRNVGKIEIITTPVGFYVRAHDLFDYTNLYFGDDHGPENFEEQNQRMVESNETGGFQSDGFTSENSKGKFFLGGSRNVYKHEIQHAVYDLIKSEIGDVWSSGLFREQVFAMWESFPGDKNDVAEDTLQTIKKEKEARRIISELYEKRLEYVLDRGKDEILAYVADGYNSTNNISNILVNNDLYNYYEIQKELLTSDPYISSYNIKIPKQIEDKISEISDWGERSFSLNNYQENEVKKIQEYLNTFKENIGHEIFVEKYHHILCEGIECVQKLKDRGVKKDIIVSILTHEPLEKWPKVVKRLLDKNDK